MLTANAGYTFTGLAKTNAKINTQEVTTLDVASDGSTATLSYQFPATSAPLHVVSSIEVKTQPAKMAYTDGDYLDLAGIVVTLKYRDGSPDEDVPLEDFSKKSITTNPPNGWPLNNLIHNNNGVLVIYTYNKNPISAYTNDLKVTKKGIPTIAIEGIPLKPDSPDGKEFTYVSPECKGKDNININVNQDNAKITINGIERDALTKELSYEGEQIEIVITPDVGAREEYTLTVKKPFPWEGMVKKRWGNTLTVIDNSRDNPYVFTNYKWYRNDREVGSGRSWSVGMNGEKLNPKDNYYVEATTQEGKIIRSCEVAVEGIAQQGYGILLKNNSAYSNIGIEIFTPEESSEMEIAVYDIAGKQVFKQKGNYTFHWNLTDAMQRRVSNGLYFVIAKAKGESGKLYRYSAKLVVKR